MDWILFFLAHFGLAYIVGHARVSLRAREILGGYEDEFDIREGEAGAAESYLVRAGQKPLFPGGDVLASLLECPACFGWWTGFFSGLVALAPRLSLGPWLAAGLLGLVVSASNFILAKVTKLI